MVCLGKRSWEHGFEWLWQLVKSGLWCEACSVPAMTVFSGIDCWRRRMPWQCLYEGSWVWKNGDSWDLGTGNGKCWLQVDLQWWRSAQPSTPLSAMGADFQRLKVFQTNNQQNVLWPLQIKADRQSWFRIAWDALSWNCQHGMVHRWPADLYRRCWCLTAFFSLNPMPISCFCGKVHGSSHAVDITGYSSGSPQCYYTEPLLLSGLHQWSQKSW